MPSVIYEPKGAARETRCNNLECRADCPHRFAHRCENDGYSMECATTNRVVRCVPSTSSARSPQSVKAENTPVSGVNAPRARMTES